MNRYALEAVRIRLKHTKTDEQSRTVIDSYPELQGMTKATVMAMTEELIPP